MAAALQAEDRSEALARALSATRSLQSGPSWDDEIETEDSFLTAAASVHDMLIALTGATASASAALVAREWLSFVKSSFADAAANSAVLYLAVVDSLAAGDHWSPSGRSKFFATLPPALGELELLRLKVPALDSEVGKQLENALADASAFVARLPSDVGAPVVSANEDGEVVLEWRRDGRRAIAGFEGDQKFGYALLHDGRFRPGAHEGTVTADKLPEDLIAYLRQ